MNKVLLFIFILSHTILSAQPADFSVIEGLPFKRVMGMRGGADEKGNVCYVYHSNGYAHYTLIDSSGKVMHQPKFQVDDDFKVVAIIATDKDFCIYYTDASNMHTTTLNLLLLNKTDGSDSTLLHFDPIEDKKEDLVSLIETYNQLYVITCDKSERKDKKVFLKTYKGTGQYTTTEIKSDMPHFYDHFKKGGFRVMKPSNSNFVMDGIYTKKIYPTDAVLWFVFDGFQLPLTTDLTEILKVDISTGNSEYYVYQPDTQEYYFSHNSFLLDTFLFRGMCSAKRVELSIFNANDMTLLRKHTVWKGKDFYLKDDSLYISQPGRYLPKTAAINNPNKLIRKFDNGSASVLAKRYKDTVSILFGSYTIKKNLRLTPDAIELIYHFAQIGREGKGRHIIASLSADTFDKIEAPLSQFNPPAHYLDHLEKKNISFNHAILFNHPDGTFLAYIDKQEKTIRIVKL